MTGQEARVMKVNAQYRHVFDVTRAVEIDREAFDAWVQRELDRGNVYASAEESIEAYLNLEDTEFHAEVFSDWRTSEPLPSDFELQWSDVIEVTLHADGSGR